MKILLVEDDMEISAMLKSFLMTENYEVITASDGEIACEKFFSDDFNLVLLDLMDENAVNVHISRLRTKIEDDPRNPRYIITVWGIGYKAGDL